MGESGFQKSAVQHNWSILFLRNVTETVCAVWSFVFALLVVIAVVFESRILLFNLMICCVTS